MKLTHIYHISEKRKKGAEIVNQAMFICVDYDKDHDTVDDIEVHVYENGVYKGEISKLLDKAEGSPLTAMVDAIDWREMADQYDEYDGNYMDEDNRRTIASVQQMASNYPHLAKA